MDLDGLDINLCEDVRAEASRLVELRRDFHRNPEVQWEERRTQARVLEELADAGIEGRAVADTGVVAEIIGADAGPTLLLRADMDALPIQEQCDHDYASTIPDRMHACGHDGHMAMLLVVARLLKRWGLARGRVRLVFQPAEEGGDGARTMIRAGILDGVEAALSFHVWSPWPLGRVVALDGATCASFEAFRIHLTGRGTHSSAPDTGTDLIAAAAHLITAAQTLVTRRISPLDPTVLSFTAVQAGTTTNVIPATGELLGTYRAFDATAHETIRQGLTDLCAGLVPAFGVTATYEALQVHPPVVNHPDVARQVRAAAADVVGADRVDTPRPLMIGEDFGHFLADIPGTLALLGCGNADAGIIHPHHHPCFDLDERVLPIGVEIALRFVDAHLATGGPA
jgi:amidohydrolase